MTDRIHAGVCITAGILFLTAGVVVFLDALHGVTP